MSDLAYVFGYASLVALPEGLAVEGGEHAPLPGRLHGYRRFWGAAMDNWEGGEGVKHWLDRESGERPRIRVAYLDLYEQAGSAVNGLVLPVDAARLAVLDAREINYARIDVTDAFEPGGGDTTTPEASPSIASPTSIPDRVFTYLGVAAARERCRQGVAEGNVFVSSDYAGSVRRAFEQLAPGALAEFDRTTDPLPFPERDLQAVMPSEDV